VFALPWPKGHDQLGGLCLEPGQADRALLETRAFALLILFSSASRRSRKAPHAVLYSDSGASE